MTDHPQQNKIEGEAKTLPAFLPLYLQIKTLLLQKLQAGHWAPGELIPSEVELAQHFKVSQGTVRKAIDTLVSEHLLIRQQGKGTFVATHAKETTQYRFLRLTPDELNTAPGLQKVRRAFISLEVLQPPPQIFEALEIKPYETVIHIKRTLTFEAKPIILEDIWLPFANFKSLTLQQMSDYDGPTYALFEVAFGIRMVRANEKIKATIATPEQALLLNVEQSAPLLSVERIAFTYNDRPMELRHALYDTSSYHYRNSLS